MKEKLASKAANESKIELLELKKEICEIVNQNKSPTESISTNSPAHQVIYPTEFPFVKVNDEEETIRPHIEYREINAMNRLHSIVNQMDSQDKTPLYGQVDNIVKSRPLSQSASTPVQCQDSVEKGLPWNIVYVII